ncbi:OLC1v1000764C1 [Oldenlandia corymbosa var. corymbosa]|uniref:Bidirectional sugar transporter SWEET n=1 Tax=Oldenlandia corymbosa var. corymbosa TaxID=529605 RepID=A0AAV1D3R2_OLDCO|nr:OLC1v1000764C1 [Oldenlandia corymbosa var. corymbosa]
MNPKMKIARTVLGVIGNITSGALFLSPVPTFRRIWKNKSTLEYHPYPYLAGVLNCIFWVLYSMPFVHPHSTLITTINSFGLFLYLCYLAMFFYYTDPKIPAKSKDRLKVVVFLILELIFAGAISAVTKIAFHNPESRTKFVGSVCVVFGIILYGSPLSVMRKIIKTKSAEFMPFWISLAGFSNGIVWSAYAFLPLDFFVLTGNGIGALLSTIQLILQCMYRNTTPKNKTKPSEVQLQIDANKTPV